MLKSDKIIFKEGYMKGYMDGAQRYNNDFSDVYIIDNILSTLKEDSKKLIEHSKPNQNQSLEAITHYIKILSNRLEDYKGELFQNKVNKHKKIHSSKEKRRV